MATKATLPALIRPLIEARLPDWLDVRWFMTKDEAFAHGPGAEIGWFDMFAKRDTAAAIANATDLKWLNSIYAGIDGMPLDLLIERGVAYTNGAGINAITIAEYVVMGMLTVAKGYDDVVRARDRHEWLQDSPGKIELAGSKALLLGTGAIGTLIKTRLAAFDVSVTTVRRTPGPGELGPDQWRAQLGEHDWVILAIPATPETDGMIGATELAAMKPTATLINIARGSVIDQDALIAALTSKSIAHAFLDVMTPEPLPPEHPLWLIPNAHITMHLSGRAQDKMYARSAERFLDNLSRWHRRDSLLHQVDLARGY
jgi:phosphoglycerate dehydrogenase-like enzyme